MNLALWRRREELMNAGAKAMFLASELQPGPTRDFVEESQKEIARQLAEVERQIQKEGELP